MRIASAFLAGTLCVLANDPSLLRYAAPNARVLSGIDVVKSRNTVFGRYVLSEMDIDDDELKKFATAAGFDVTRDLTEILISTTGDAEDARTLIVGRGSFHPEKVVSSARSQGATILDYAGVPIISHKGTKIDGAVAFPDSFTALAGDVDSVRSALDRLQSPTQLSPELNARIRDLSSTFDAWFVSTGHLSEFLTGKVAEQGGLGDGVQGNLLATVRQASGGMRFQPDSVSIAGEALANSAKDAQSLAEVLKFIAGLVQVKTGPDAKKSSLADVARIATQGSKVNLSIEVPETTMEQMFSAETRTKKSKPAR